MDISPLKYESDFNSSALLGYIPYCPFTSLITLQVRLRNAAKSKLVRWVKPKTRRMDRVAPAIVRAEWEKGNRNALADLLCHANFSEDCMDHSLNRWYHASLPLQTTVFGFVSETEDLFGNCLHPHRLYLGRRSLWTNWLSWWRRNNWWNLLLMKDGLLNRSWSQTWNGPSPVLSHLGYTIYVLVSENKVELNLL